MKKKKTFMIIILIAFIGVIGVVLANVNNQSVEKISQKNTTNNTNTTSTTNSLNTNSTTNSTFTTTQSIGKVRKSTEKAKVDTSNIVEITDNFFIEQTNDLYINLNDYIGKTIKIEGLIYSYEDSNGDICYAVVRNTPGCCGSDGLAGLDIRYDEDYPEEDTWVEVIGLVGSDTVYGSKIPAIQVSSLTLKEKGTTFVTN
ncbi:MAG: hypothetical protein IKM97_01045 [Clostridia bacterium]|nr:hypothetical protein [Clostridia bacterium]